MFSFVLRLTSVLITVVILLVMLMQVVGKGLPLDQIIPLVTYNSPTILLIDANRHLGAARRTNPSAIFDAVVSPDQQRIAFSMSNNRNIHVFVGSLYDAQYQQLTSEDMGGTNPAWSSDGRQIAFVGLERDNKRGIYTLPIDGSTPLQTIVKAGTYASPAWSPNGHQLVFTASRYRDLPDLFVLDEACRLRCDREMIQITDDTVMDTSPVWSPDGTKIAFLSDQTGDYEIYLLDMSCLQNEQPKCNLQMPKRLHLERPIVPVIILWSLDGQEIYFRGWDASSNQPGLYAVHADCYSLPEGCQPRMIYNLANVLLDKGG